MAKLDDFANEEIEAAQDKLNDLCKQYDIKPFEIKHTGSDSKKWHALVLRMCGLNFSDPKRGAKKDENTDDLLRSALLLLDFWQIDKKTGKPPTKEAIYHEVVKARKVAPKDRSSGKKTKPENAVKKALAKYMEERKKKTKK